MKKKLSFKRIFWLAFLLLIILLFVCAFLILNRPSASLTAAERNQALQNLLGRQVVFRETPIITGNIEHKGKYVSFLYPKAAKEFTLLVNGQPAMFDDLEHFSFNIADNHTHFMSEVRTYPSAQVLSDYPGVRLRQGESQTYTQTTVISADKTEGLAFSKYDITSGYEKTAFFLVDGKIYTFTVQCPEEQALNNLFSSLIPTIKFLD